MAMASIIVAANQNVRRTSAAMASRASPAASDARRQNPAAAYAAAPSHITTMPNFVEIVEVSPPATVAERQAELLQQWTNVLTQSSTTIPLDCIHSYAAALSEQCISLHYAANKLTDSHFVEMKVRIGHRSDIVTAAANALAIISDNPAMMSSVVGNHFHSHLSAEAPSPDQNGLTTSAPGRVPEVDIEVADMENDQQQQQQHAFRDGTVLDSLAPVKASFCVDETPEASPANTNAAGGGYVGGDVDLRRRRISLSSFSPDLSSRMKQQKFQNKVGVKWISACGSEETFERFFESMSALRRECSFPDTFDRSFLDNKPMPLQIVQGSSILLILRIPDHQEFDCVKSAKQGTQRQHSHPTSSVSTITNRFVLMFSARKQCILTYHRCDYDFLRRVGAEWESKCATASVWEVVEKLLKRVVDTYAFGIEQLQDAFDDAEDIRDRFVMVERLMDIQRRAQVLSRCIRAGISELENWLSDNSSTSGISTRFAAPLAAIVDHCRSIASSAEELMDNAASAMDMQMALDGFRSSKNMKIFTLLAIFCQPVTVATGWYGMNWTNFPELVDENGYFIFSGAVLGFAVLLLILFIVLDWRS